MASNLPDDTQRLSIIGATGSGKTQAGLWHLSERNFNIKPWVVYDFKHESLIAEIEEMAFTSSLESPPPDRPGIYVVHALPDEEDAISEHMRRIWEHTDIGVYVDEGYMVGNNNKGFRLLLTQGRSLHIPIIVLSQRPVWMDRFVFTESEFIQVFRLNSIQDVKKVGEYVPGYEAALAKHPLKKYHSYYYNGPENRLMRLGPVPDREAILDKFHSKLRGLKKVV